MARDAQLSNDRVAEQSFLQHAEHYTRLLGEAQREQAERQQHFSPQRDEDGGRDDTQERSGNGNGNGNGNGRDGHGSDAEGQSGGERQQRDYQREDGNRQREHGNRSNAHRDRDNRDNRRERRNDSDAVTEAAGTIEAGNEPQPQVHEAAAPAAATTAPAAPAKPAGFARDEDQPGLPLAIASSDEDAAHPVETPETLKAVAAEDRPAPRRRTPRAAPAAPRATAPRSRKKADPAGDAPAEPVGEGKAD